MAEEEKDWGYLRETKDKANDAGKDSEHDDLIRTGLDEYLEDIFREPKVEWIHDKCIPKARRPKDDCQRLCRPDYRSDELSLIVEFDGAPHYTNAETIIKDIDKTEWYRACGYKVIRIPYFIQLTKDTAKKFFGNFPGSDVEKERFLPGIASFNFELKATPAWTCPLGLLRMAEYFYVFPEQFVVNRDYLRSKEPDDRKTGLDLLEREMSFLKGKAPEDFIFVRDLLQ